MTRFILKRLALFPVVIIERLLDWPGFGRLFSPTIVLTSLRNITYMSYEVRGKIGGVWAGYAAQTPHLPTNCVSPNLLISLMAGPMRPEENDPDWTLESGDYVLVVGGALAPGRM